MQKPLTYALLLAVTLGLAACNKPPEDKTESAQAPAPAATESPSAATPEPAAVPEQKTEQPLTPPPTSDEPTEQ